MTIIDIALTRIASESPKIIGWCPLEKAFELATLVFALRPALVVEIGVYGGKSLIPMALACAALNHGRVVGIDPWNAAESKQGYSGPNAEWWGALDHEAIYQSFIGHLDRLALRDFVTVRRSPSDAIEPPEVIDLLSLDGQHTEQAIRDVERFCPRIRIGGVVVVDDLGWVNSGIKHVALAVDKLISLGFVELSRSECDGANWGVFQRVK